MKVNVRLPGALRRLVGEQDLISIDLAEGAVLMDLAQSMATTYHGIGERIFSQDGRGDLNRNILFFVDGEDSRFWEGEPCVLVLNHAALCGGIFGKFQEAEEGLSGWQALVDDERYMGSHSFIPKPCKRIERNVFVVDAKSIRLLKITQEVIEIFVTTIFLS